MTHSKSSTARSAHWTLDRSRADGPAKLLDLGGYGRRRFLTMAGIGSAATAVCVSIAALDPALFFGPGW
ncbi:hypothetical protein [Myceligenerans crystallogenes]|uniref:Tat (Twin-arginine translocation) pathway signal sequence n=1 Tax=Myceligenerans crystallogenes TaxID=316335 RepID=A0ABP4ZQF9_9MICO